MMPRKLHLEQINRFHDTLERIDAQIETETDEKVKAELLIKYFKLTKLWAKVDDAADDLKTQLDILM